MFKAICRRTTVLSPAAIVLCLLAASASAGQLQLVKGDKNSPGRIGRNDVIDLRPVDAKTVSDRQLELPKFTSDKPLMFHWPLYTVRAVQAESGPADKPALQLLAIDKSKADGPYDLLYVDADLDGKFDGKCISGKSVSQDGVEQIDFLQVNISLGQDGYCLDLHLTYADGQGRLKAEAACWREGEITAGERTFWCTLIDANADGRFTEPYNRRRGDVIRIAAKDDKGHLNPLTDCVTRNVGKYVEIDGQYYELTISLDGSSASLTAARPAMGKVFVQGNIDAFSLTGPNGQFFCKASPEGSPVPAGMYDLCRWQQDRKAADGKAWSAIGQAASIVRFQVPASDGVALPPLQPLQCQVRCFPDQSMVYQRFVGLRGEQVNLLLDGKGAAAQELTLEPLGAQASALKVQAEADGTYSAGLPGLSDAPSALQVTNRTPFEIAPFKHMITPQNLQPADASGLIYGVVMDEDGNACAGAAVRLYSLAPIDAALMPILRLECQTSTNDRGEFVIAGSASQSCLIVRKAGMAMQWASIIPDEAGMMQIRLQRQSRSFKGKVVDEQGKAIEGADVYAVVSHGMATFVCTEPSDWFRARTNDQGEFIITDVPVSVGAEFFAVAPGYARAYTFNLTRMFGQFNTNSGIAITLPREGKVEGKLTDADGKPLPGKKIAVVRQPARELNACIGLSDKDGKYVVYNLPPGKACVQLADPAQQITGSQFEPNIEIESGKTLTHNLKAE